MAERSKRIELLDRKRLNEVNQETMKLYKKYLIDMGMRELSPNSIYNYETDLFAWFIFILDYQDNRCVTELEEDDITEFLYYCKMQGNNTRRIKRRMSSLSAFYKFLRKKRIIANNPMEMIDRPRKDIDVVEQTYLTKEQVAEMKKKLKEYGDLQLELYALLSLSTMARVNAIANIKWEQIDFEQRIIKNVLEKEQRYVDLFFNNECKQLLLKLKEQREKDNINCEYVFITYYKGKYDAVSTNTLNNWCAKVGEMINVPTLHPHDLRHSMATILKNSGMPLESVSKLLNHMSTDVTLKFYIKEDVKKIQAEKDMFDI